MRCLARLGRVTIFVTDAPSESATLTWDDAGKAALEDGVDDSCCRFEATRDVWISFIYKGSSVARLVIAGRIRYSCPPVVLLRCGTSFERLALIGRALK